MRKTILALAAMTIGGGLPVAADPTIGVGVSFVFGGGNVDTGLGVRILSDDEEGEVAATLGVDYMFGSNRVRPTIGAAYLADQTYFGFDIGFDPVARSADFGLSGGFAETVDTKAPIIATVEEPDVDPELPPDPEFPVDDDLPFGDDLPFDDQNT